MKKNLKFLLLSGIIITLLIPIFGSARAKNEEINILSQMLEELDGEFLEGDVNIGGVILDDFLNEKQLKYIGKDIEDKMELIETEVELINEDGFNQLAIYGYDRDENEITLFIGSYLDSGTGVPETTLFINLIKRGKNFSINGIIERIEKIFKEFDKPIEITTCIIGTIEGIIDYNSLELRIHEVMDNFHVKLVEEYIDKSIISYTGYTPLIDDSIFSGKNKINLNLAIRYNEDENKNYIWIGTPIITTGY